MSDQHILGHQWRAVAEALSIQCIAPFCISLPDGTEWEFACLLPQFGGGRGMLVTTEHSREAFSAALAAGYTCSTMSAEKHHLPIDAANYTECLADWGWSAKDQQPPGWYKSAA